MICEGSPWDSPLLSFSCLLFNPRTVSGGKPPAQILNHKKFLFNFGFRRLVTFLDYGLGTKCNDDVANRCTGSVRHDLKHVWSFRNLQNFTL